MFDTSEFTFKSIYLFRTLAQKEKLEKEARRFIGRKSSYMQVTIL